MSINIFFAPVSKHGEIFLIINDRHEQWNLCCADSSRTNLNGGGQK